MCWFIDLRVSLRAPIHAWRPPKTIAVRAHGHFPDYLLSDSGICSCDLVLADGAQLASDVLASLDTLLRDEAVLALALSYYWSRPPRRFSEQALSLARFEALNRDQALSPGELYRLVPVADSCAAISSTKP
ncbi:MAG: hypothetical protein ACAI44_35560 [Candidatus Sericytochromatia bacterium]